MNDEVFLALESVQRRVAQTDGFIYLSCGSGGSRFNVCLEDQVLFQDYRDLDLLMLAEVLGSVTGLQKLVVSHFPLDDVFGGVLLKKLKHLVHLDLSMSGLRSAKCIAESLKKNTSVSYLVLGFNPLGQEGGAALAEALQVNTCLSHLNLFSTSIGGSHEAIARALCCNNTLKELNLGYNLMGDEGGMAMGEALKVNRSITHIHLTLNNFGTSSAQALGAALSVNDTLLMLDLSCNTMGSRGAQMIFEGLCQNRFLTKLNLRSNEIIEGAECAQTLCQVLQSSQSLTSLDLSDNPLQGASLYLRQGLMANQSLRHLDLSKTECLSEELMDVFAIHPSLTRLVLSDNQLGQFLSIFYRLCRALKTRRSGLRELDISENQLGSECAAHLADAIRNNYTLKHLNVHGNNDDFSKCNVLLDAFRDNGSLVCCFGMDDMDMEDEDGHKKKNQVQQWCHRNADAHQQVLEAVVMMLAIRRRQKKDYVLLHVLPKEIVALIAKHFWNTRSQRL